ncbi:uncharacterized protein LOC120673732 isoform X2 [Panicum virgatum]|uniref:uncharacterized protein LOC120673732 isoform X2 n=1 Tax=Panicum virgatum TaxID=38727 RepID=UPI0019D5ED0C|nr:uncharacterized protein LOC120673732 isoform X2 [Panicum virgatum]
MTSHHHSFSATFQVNPDMVPEYKSNMVQRHFISARRHIIRPTDQDYAQGYKIMFTDCFTFLIASQDSLDALNEILKEHVPMNHFRPNGWMPTIFGGPMENHKDKQPNILRREAMQPLQDVW